MRYVTQLSVKSDQLGDVNATCGGLHSSPGRTQPVITPGYLHLLEDPFQRGECMTSTLKKFGTTASAIGLLTAGMTFGIAPSAQAAVGPTGCTAYVSHTNDHVAVGACRSGNGTWNVQAWCGGPGGARAPTRAPRLPNPWRGEDGDDQLRLLRLPVQHEGCRHQVLIRLPEGRPRARNACATTVRPRPGVPAGRPTPARDDRDRAYGSRSAGATPRPRITRSLRGALSPARLGGDTAGS